MVIEYYWLFQQNVNKKKEFLKIVLNLSSVLKHICIFYQASVFLMCLCSPLIVNLLFEGGQLCHFVKWRLMGEEEEAGRLGRIRMRG